MGEQQAADSSSDDEEEAPPVKIKMATVRESVDNLLKFIDSTDNLAYKGYYPHLRSLQELIIKDQYKSLTQASICDFFKPPASTSDAPPSPPPSPTPSTSFAGFE